MRFPLFHNWPQKLIALATATIIWLFVNQSINATKTIPNIPIRIVNLPTDKTALGLLSNGLLSKRVNLTLTGRKGTIEELEAGDLEVLIDASANDEDEWAVQIGKKNLFSLNPNINVRSHISQVAHAEFIVRLSPLITAEIPVNVRSPRGTAPPGYQFLDIWPQKLTQRVTGPEEEINKLKVKGLKLTPNLDHIPKAMLDALVPINDSQGGVVSFSLPKEWRRVYIPFQNSTEEINDPHALLLRIHFLKKAIIPLEKEIPIRIFYPLKTSHTINPLSTPLLIEETIEEVDRIPVLSHALYAKGVSRFFLDIVKNKIEIVVVASGSTNKAPLPWSVQILDPKGLEELFVTKSLASQSYDETRGETALEQNQEQLLRNRFRDYVQHFELYQTTKKPLRLHCSLEQKGVRVSIDTP